MDTTQNDPDEIASDAGGADDATPDETASDSAPSPELGKTRQSGDPYEGAVPPGYDWPTHGGYLGCLLGLMASCLIGGFAAKLVGLFTYYHRITGVANVLILLAVFAVATVLITNLGWRLGRRFFREYAQQPTWGESDEFRQSSALATPDGSHIAGDEVDDHAD